MNKRKQKILEDLQGNVNHEKFMLNFHRNRMYSHKKAIDEHSKNLEDYKEIISILEKENERIERR